MQTHPPHDFPPQWRERMRASNYASAFTWGMTFMLLALVAAIFAFGGTAGAAGGLYARMVAVSFMVVALLIFIMGRTSKT